MKKILLVFVLFVLVKANGLAQLPDLPSGGNTTYGAQTLPAGSLVIGMDNTTQPGSGTIMNLRAYGLLTTLLNNDKKLKWVIKPGKALDGIDFSANAQKMVATGTNTNITKKTTTSAGSAIIVVANNTGITVGMSVSSSTTGIQVGSKVVSISGVNITLSLVATASFTNKDVIFTSTATTVTFNAAANYDFKSGPFVIFQPDTAGVANVVAVFNASGFGVSVYRTTAAVQVNVRYDYIINGSVWKPKAAILNDGGNAKIHEAYMDNAGVPGSNWTEELNVGFISNCYTFASEPHNDKAPDNVISGIRNFVLGGGNFLAECAAVRTYEASALARFQSTNGFDDAHENGDPATWTYSNTDLSYFQINGYFGIADEGGSLKDWVIPQAPGNPPVNNFHYFNSGAKNGFNYTNASASKLFPTNVTGGMVYYLGGHSYDGNNDYDINGQRMYLNAFLTPNNPQGSLVTGVQINCSHNPVIVNTSSTAGPASAYPMTFTLYEDLPPQGYNAADPQRGNVVTMTGPNAYSGASTITANVANNFSTWIVVTRPANGCFQPRFLSQFCTTLPVSLMDFSAARNSSLVNLKWTTTSEQNCKGFNIERMLGNGNWETIGFVNSRAPGGNSSSNLSYTYVDPNNFKGVSQYRLQQVDLTGQLRASEIRAVRGEDQKAGGVTVYPNPSEGTLHVLFADNNSAIRDISVNDMMGRTVKEWKGVTTNNMQIENLAPGMYSLRVVDRATGEQTIEKIIITKR